MLVIFWVMPYCRHKTYSHWAGFLIVTHMSPKVMLVWVIKLNVILMTKWNSLYHFENKKRVSQLQLTDMLMLAFN